jgi:hypothetical protein
LPEQNDRYQVDSKAFDHVRHQLLLDEIFVGIITARCKWLGSYLSERIQKNRIGDGVSKDIKGTSGAAQGSHLGALWTIWDYVRVIFYADDMKHDLNKLVVRQKLIAPQRW